MADFDNRRPGDRLTWRQSVELIDRHTGPAAQPDAALATWRSIGLRRQDRFVRHARQHTYHRGARIHQHRALFAQCVGVEFLMTVVEPLNNLRQRVGDTPVDVVQRHVDLEDLLAVAHLHRALHAHRPVERRAQTRESLLLHFGEQPFDADAVQPLRVADMSPGNFEAQIRRQHAPGRQHRCDARHDDPSQIELTRDIRHMQPGGAAERQQRETARIDAAPHRDQTNALRHVGVDDAMHAFGRGDAIHLQRVRKPIHRLLRSATVERAGAAEEVVRIEIAEHEVGIRHCRFATTLAVARRPRHRSCAFRTDMQDAARVDTADRAAAGAQADDVEAVQRQPMPADAPSAHQRGLAVDDQADIRAGAAHVERDQVVAVEQSRRITAARDTAGGTRQHAAGGHARRFDDRRDTAMRLDDQDRPAIARLDKPLFQPAQIARQRRPDIGVHHRRRDAVELLDLREHFGRQRHICIGHRIRERDRRFAFVPRIAVGVQVAHRNRLDAGSFQFGNRGIERRVIKRRLDAAVGAHALRHAEAQRTRHQLLRRRHAEVIAVVLQSLAHLDDIAMAFGGQQPDLGALVLQQGIGGDGGAMHDALGLGQQLVAGEVQDIRQPTEAGHHSDRRILRRGRDFCQRGAAAGIHRDKVGEGAANIDADLQHAGKRPLPPTPSRKGRGRTLSLDVLPRTSDEPIDRVAFARGRIAFCSITPASAAARFDFEHVAGTDLDAHLLRLQCARLAAF